MRRWRQTLAEQQMEVGDNLLQALMDAGLLTEDVVKLIKVVYCYTPANTRLTAALLLTLD
jgi:hypothetical protein